MTENKDGTRAEKTQKRALGKMSEEEIDYNIMGSFPASDPPSWTLGLRPRKTFQTNFENESPGPHEPTHQNE